MPVCGNAGNWERRQNNGPSPWQASAAPVSLADTKSEELHRSWRRRHKPKDVRDGKS